MSDEKELNEPQNTPQRDQPVNSRTDVRQQPVVGPIAQGLGVDQGTIADAFDMGAIVSVERGVVTIDFNQILA